MKALFDFVAVRVAVIALTTALVSAGSVYFVVDIALRGIETAQHTTNERISDVAASVRELSRKSDRILSAIAAERTASTGALQVLCSVDDSLRDQLRRIASTQKTHLAALAEDSNVAPVAGALLASAAVFEAIAGEAKLSAADRKPEACR